MFYIDDENLFNQTYYHSECPYEEFNEYLSGSAEYEDVKPIIEVFQMMAG